MDDKTAITAGITVKSDSLPASSAETDCCAMSSTTAQCHDVRVVTCHNDVNELLSRPILVGYAFGPKKMSTMGVVMAEASKTHLSSVSTTVLVEEDEEDDLDNDDKEQNHQHQRHREQKMQQEQDSQVISACDTTTDAAASPGEITESLAASTKTATTAASRPSPRRKSIDSGNNCGNKVVLSLDSYNGGLKNIVRYLHSSCSSVDTNSTTTTFGTTVTGGGVTPSSGASNCGGGHRQSAASMSAKSYSSGGEPQQRLRVSFVPLDPDFSLEGQHGAKMDIILHKLTEDILCLSKYAPTHPNLVPNLGNTDGELERKLQELQVPLPSDAQAAIMRVHRLMRYQKKFPECSLADDPAKVLTLMSRSDIANALANCLVGVKSASGIPVASPRFLVWDQEQMDKAASNDSHKKGIAKCIRDANISYPLIAKPLQAAGTKISHHMTVLLHESSLEHVQNSSCLLQEYANHNAVLYKVYVLGNNVRVYQRPSLPNLPPLAFTGELAGPSYVDFDSQRPYPRLSAFGVKDEGNDDSRRPYLSSIAPSAPSSSGSPSLAVTSDEVQPIVDTLKQAFGLELFGFDILITSTARRQAQHDNGEDQNPSSANERKMLVVDVNYFPSYKEMSNFPSLLAQYLTQRAIDSRRQEPPRSAATAAPTFTENSP